VLAASGDLVAPLDADDVLLPDHLATVVPLVDDERTIVAVGRRRWMPGVALATPRRSGSPVPPVDRQVAHILRGNFLFAGSVVHRNALLAIGGGSEMRRADDWETWIRLIVEVGCRIVASPGETVLYRTDPRSLSAADRCLPDEIALCTRLLQEPPYRPHLRTLEASVRRREARLLLLDGLRLAGAGDAALARRRFLRAMATDRSLRGGTGPAPLGSVTVRAACALASPRLARRARDRRLAADALADPPTRPGTNGAG
jgi:cellulose synthase/poly-beta-1,6-N-acetylglucosamine synthase-like glycosyltransferase